MGKGHRDRLIRELDRVNSGVGELHRCFLRLVAELERFEHWRDLGARDLPHVLSMRFGISMWKAHRVVQAAGALERLPALARALGTGELSLDKVLELARFATPEDEERLIRWAREVSPAAVRKRADRAVRLSLEQDREAHRSRTCSWWFYDEDRRFGLFADLPAAEGAKVARALERVAETIPVLPGEEDPYYADARRADALVALASSRLAADPEPDRATVVVHAPLEAIERPGDGSDTRVQLEDGPVLHPETARRLLCHARVQVLVEDAAGRVVGAGRTTREPPAWMVRHLRYRDGGCVFPGCGTRAFTVAHHVRWWSRGGETIPDNLALICSFHHRLVHEDGWGLGRDRDGSFRWFRPNGRPHAAGRAPTGPRVETAPGGSPVGSVPSNHLPRRLLGRTPMPAAEEPDVPAAGFG